MKRTSWFRKFLWWYHGGYRRLLAARERRLNRPATGLRILVGPHGTAKIIIDLIRRIPDPVARHAFQMSLLRDLTAPK